MRRVQQEVIQPPASKRQMQNGNLYTNNLGNMKPKSSKDDDLFQKPRLANIKQKFHVQNNGSITSKAEAHNFKSNDFGENPLLSNSKLWKHSPIKNESHVKKNVEEIEDSFCSYSSPNAHDLSIAEEGLSSSPIPRIQQLPNPQFTPQIGNSSPQ